MIETLINNITNEKFYLPVFSIAIGIIIYHIIAGTIIKISKINSEISEKYNKNHSKEYDKRKSTIISLINNIIKYIIAIIIIIYVLNIYGINTSSILASIGIAGAIIGLAFQDIIKDFLAGMFIVFDNAYAVGDWITIDGFKGEVISVGLKTTKIKAYTGEVMILSNSSFNKVTNFNLETPKLFIKIPVNYQEDLTKVEEVINKVLIDLKENDSDVKKTEMLGVDSFDESSMKYAVTIDCNVGTYIRIRRKFLRNIKLAFDKNKIVIPYNQLDIHMEK
ncbi:MAG: mechanosensitive ion channel family protein [Bacilli bacterium]|nr:mechanosensitive ion channel family protein [Bacilli bacterium]